jgi:mono/diheme cytochrome c family protein
MRKLMIAGLALLTAASMMIAACGGSEPAPTTRGKGAQEVARLPVPDEYQDRMPPEGFDMKDPEVIEQGRKLFADAGGPNCASCHGPEGKGDGPLNTTDPRPTDLTADEFRNSEHVTDQYIYWRIKTGGEGYARVGGRMSAMTGYTTGTPEEIWSLIAFVRSLGE